jgi:subtilisin family serine protease
MGLRKLYLSVITYLFFVIACNAQNVNANYVDGELYFKVNSSFNGTLDINHPLLAPLAALYQMDSCTRPFMGFSVDSLDRTYLLHFRDTAKTQLCMDTLRSLAIIDYVEQVPLYRTSFVVNDLNVNQWGLVKINASQAWDVSRGSANVVIAIVDNGVRTTHEDLAANLWVNTGEIPNNGFDDDFNGYTDDVNGYDLADGDGNPNPPTGISTTDAFNHGTHCAGIASAVTNNNKGIASIGFGCKIMAVKCTKNTDDGGLIRNAMDGVTYAMRNNANIISMSFGSEGTSTTEQLILNTAHNKGIILVAAAGNDNVSTPFYPASYANVISVGATDRFDQKAAFSNFGSTVDVMAPGLDIFSTLASGNNTDYGSFSGTSMACPLVAGLCGLVLAVRPNFTPAQVENQLKVSADNIDILNPGFTGKLGAGRINARNTLDDFGTVNSVITNASNNSIQVYPNPFTNNVNVKFETVDNATIELLDATGRMVSNINNATNYSEITTSKLPAGVYILKVTQAADTDFYKLVKGE